MVHLFEIWIQEVGPDARRAWVLTRGAHYAADAARIPTTARLVWEGEATEAEAERRVTELLGLPTDDDGGDASMTAR